MHSPLNQPLPRESADERVLPWERSLMASGGRALTFLPAPEVILPTLNDVWLEREVRGSRNSFSALTPSVTQPWPRVT